MHVRCVRQAELLQRRYPPPSWTLFADHSFLDVAADDATPTLPQNELSGRICIILTVTGHENKKQVHLSRLCDVGTRYPATSSPPTAVCVPQTGHLTGRARDDVQQNGRPRGWQRNATNAASERPFSCWAHSQSLGHRAGVKHPHASARAYCNMKRKRGSHDRMPRSILTPADGAGDRLHDINSPIAL